MVLQLWEEEYELAAIHEAHRFVDTGRERGNVVLRLTRHERERPPSTLQEAGR